MIHGGFSKNHNISESETWRRTFKFKRWQTSKDLRTWRKSLPFFLLRAIDWLCTNEYSMRLENDPVSFLSSFSLNHVYSMHIVSVDFMPLLCSVSTFGHRHFYVIFMRLKLAIQRQRTFNGLHMGTGQQMSIPEIHISCQNWNVSPIHQADSSTQGVRNRIYLSPSENNSANYVASGRAVSR